MKLSKFSSDTLPKWGLDQKWTEALAGLVKPHLDQEQTRFFAGRVMACETPLGIRLGLVNGSPQQFSFMLAGVSDGVWVAQVLEGRALLIDGAKSTPLAPGDIAHGQLRGSAVLKFNEDFKMVVARFPNSALNARLTLMPQAMRLATQSGMGRILGAVLKAVAETIDELPEDHERAIESLLREFVLINLMINTSATTNGGPVGVQAVLLQKTYHIIDARLSDPDLSMKKVSAELRVSLRYLYKLFASSGEGFGRYVKRRRLERCRCDLSNPIYDDFNVSEICFRWGFNEAAHFSRVFREQFGMSPRSWRKESSAKRLAQTPPPRTAEVHSLEPRRRGAGKTPLAITAG